MKKNSQPKSNGAASRTAKTVRELHAKLYATAEGFKKERASDLAPMHLELGSKFRPWFLRLVQKIVRRTGCKPWQARSAIVHVALVRAFNGVRAV